MTVSIELKDDLLAAIADDPERAADELRLAAAMKLYELSRLSSGAAAELAGIPRVVFLTKLGEYGIDTFDLSEEELVADVEAARRALCR